MLFCRLILTVKNLLSSFVSLCSGLLCTTEGCEQNLLDGIEAKFYWNHCVPRPVAWWVSGLVILLPLSWDDNCFPNFSKIVNSGLCCSYQCPLVKTVASPCRCHPQSTCPRANQPHPGNVYVTSTALSSFYVTSHNPWVILGLHKCLIQLQYCLCQLKVALKIFSKPLSATNNTIIWISLRSESGFENDGVVTSFIILVNDWSAVR